MKKANTLIKEKRKEAKKILGRYGSLEVTWYKFDCGEDGCAECKVCKHLSFLEWASSVAPAGSEIERNTFIERYLKIVYP